MQIGGRDQEGLGEDVQWDVTTKNNGIRQKPRSKHDGKEK